MKKAKPKAKKAAPKKIKKEKRSIVLWAAVDHNSLGKGKIPIGEVFLTKTKAVVKTKQYTNLNEVVRVRVERL